MMWQRARIGLGLDAGRTVWTTGRPHLPPPEFAYDQGDGRRYDEPVLDTNVTTKDGGPLFYSAQALELLPEFADHVDPEPLADWLARKD